MIVPRPRKRRNRKSIVCVQCKRRKIRCDRKQPCAHCGKIGLKCEYKAEPPSKVGQTQKRTPAHDIPLGSYGLSGNPVSVEMDTIKASALSPLDTKLELRRIKSSITLTKPSRTTILGPSSRCWLLYSMPDLRSLLSGFSGTISREKHLWKSMHKSNSHLEELGGPSDEGVAIAAVSNVICPNYYAFQERLLYFENSLNSLLLSGLIPMDMVRSLFLAYFEVREGSLVVRFRKPEKAYCYADISLITAVIYVTVIFTQNSQTQFNYQLTATADDLSSLAMTLLNVSHFRRKKTHQALLSLIVLGSGLFVYDNSEGMNEQLGTYPMFQLCLDLCYQMGLYAEPDTTNVVVLKDRQTVKARELSCLEIRQLWSYMQTEDAFYSLKMGTPLLINYDFCAGFHRNSDRFFERKKEQGVVLMRELSVLANAPKPVSIRDILNMVHKVLEFCYQIPVSLLSPVGTTGDLDELAYLLKQKIIFLGSLQFLCRMVIVAVKDYYQEENTLHDISREMYRQLLISAVALLYHIKCICDGRSAFGRDGNGKYFVYFKDVLSGALGQGFMIWLMFFIQCTTGNAEVTKEFGYHTAASGFNRKDYSADLNLCTLERALYHDLNNEHTELAHVIFRRLVSSSELMAFSSSLYDTLRQNEVMKSSLNSFLTLKQVIVWAYVAQTAGECKSELKSKQMSFFDVVKRTRAKVEADFSSGRLDEMKFISEGSQLQSLLDSMFDDQDWLNMADFDPGLLFKSS
ncbi:DEKNAAC103215 [Brettanomyces naardenensis]|uniref:DEKNAAC103215 n=1 Tax=Brettanomyces naardenensis TaxID=13370 RepID=A0A448YMT8_BRENA|nr:DEKNAAC103215 [Brettanomyces naardenensis]